MPQKNTIVVFGATGAQGGGLAHAILNDKKSSFAVYKLIFCKIILKIRLF